MWAASTPGGPDPGVVTEPQDVVLAVAAEFQQVPAGCWAVDDFGPGMRGTSEQPARARRFGPMLTTEPPMPSGRAATCTFPQPHRA
jgi:hypothetical protein